MRISDWSSDVCSSDLLVPVRRQLLRAGTGLIAAGSGGRSADRTYRLSYGQRRFVVGLKPATTPGYADQPPSSWRTAGSIARRPALRPISIASSTLLCSSLDRKSAG